MKVHGYLSVIKRDGTDGSNYPVTTQTCTIGRGINNDVRIHVQTVSEEHCKIFISKFGQATLKNLSNTSSTTVNGTPIGDSEVYLGHGDIITAGDRSLRWEYLPDSQHCVASGRNTSPLCGSTAMVGMPISMLQSALGNRTFQRRSFVGSDTRKKFVSRLVTSSSQTPGRINVPVHKGAASERLVAIVSPQQRSRSEKKVSESGAVSSNQFEGSSGASCVDLGTPVTHQLKKSKTPVAASSVVKVSSPDYVTTVTTGSSPREIRSKSAKATKGSNITVNTFYRRRSLQDAAVPVPSTTTYSNKRKSAAASLASIINKTPSKRKSTILLAKTPRSMKNKKTSVKSKKKNSTPVSSSKKKAAISASKTLVTQRVERQKRKLESGLRSAERAAKRLKLESPKTPDKKKMAALMVCHGKGSRPQVTPGTKSSAKRSQSVSAEKESKIPVARFKSRSTARKIVRRKSDTNVTGKDKKSQPLASTYSLKIPESFNFKSEERKKELRVSPIEKVNRNKTPSSKGRRGRSLVSKQPSSPKLEDTINVSGIVELLESPTSIPSSKKVPVTPSSETKQKNSSKISPILLLERISTPRKSRSSELQNLSSHRNTRRKNMHTSFLKSATEDTDENIEEAEKSGTLIITPISGRMSARKLQNRKSVIRTPLSPSGPSNVKKLSSTPRSATSRVSFVATPQSGRKLRYSSRGSQSPKSPVIDVSRMSRSSLKLGDKIKLNRSLTTPSSVRKSKGSAAKIEQMSGQLTPLRHSPGIEDINMFVSHSGRSNVSVSTRISKGSAVVSPKDNSSFIDSNDTSLSSRKRQSTTPPSVRRSRSSVGSAVKNEPEFGLFTPKRSSSVGDTSRSVSPLSRSGLSASTRKSKGSAIVSPKDNSTFIDFKDDSLSPRRGQTTTPSSVRRSSSSVGSAVKNDTPKRNSSGGDTSRSVSPLSRSGLSASTRKSKGSAIVSPKDNSTFIDFKDDSLSPRRGQTTTPPSVRRSSSSVGSAVKNDSPKRNSSGGDTSRSVSPLSRSGLSASTRKSKGSAIVSPKDNSTFIDFKDDSLSPRRGQTTTPSSVRRSSSSVGSAVKNDTPKRNSSGGDTSRSVSPLSRSGLSTSTRKSKGSAIVSPKDNSTFIDFKDDSLSPRRGQTTTPSSVRRSSSSVGSAVKNDTPKRSSSGGDISRSVSPLSRSGLSAATRKSKGSPIVSPKDNSTFIDFKDDSLSPRRGETTTPPSVRRSRSSVGSAVKNDTPKRSSTGGDISRSVSPLSRSGLSATTRKSKGSPIVSPKDNSTFIDFKDDSLSPRRGETTTPPSVRRSRSSVGSAVKNDTPKRSSSGGDISRSVFPLSRSGLSVSTRKSKGSAVTLPEDNSAFIDSNDVSSSSREEQVYRSSTTPPSERRSRSSSEIGARNRSLSSSSRTSVSVRTRKYERSPVLSPKDISLSPRTGKFDHFSTTPSSMRESSSTGSAVKNEPEPGLFTPKRSPLGIGDENTSISRSSRSSNVSVSTRKSVGSAVVSLKDNSTFIDTKEVSFSPKTRSSRTPVRNTRRFSKIQPLRSSEKLEIVTEKSSISGEATPNSFVLPRSVLAGSAARDQKPSSSKKRVSWSQTPSSLNTTFDFDSVRTPRISLEDFVSPLSSARKRINVRLESKSMSEKKPKSEPPFKRRRLSEQIKEDSFSDMKSESSNESFITSEVQRWKTNSRQAVSLSVEYAGQNASIVKENHVVRRSFRSAMSPNNVRGAEVVVKSLRSTKSPKNDLSNVHGIKRLMKTPKSPKNDLSNIKGVKQLMKTPRSQRSPKNDLSDVHGVKQIMKTPRVQKSPKNDLTNIPGVKRLMNTPRSQKSPKNDLSDVRGVKQLLGTPKSPKSPKNDLSDVRGVGKLMKTPRSPKSPKNDLRDVRGVRKLMKTPRSPKSPRNDLSDVRGVKQLLGTPKSPKSPKNDLSDVRGVRKLMKTPRSPKSPKNDLSDVRGVRKLMKTPRSPKSPKNDLREIRGVRKLMKTPRSPKSPRNDLSDVRGVKQLLGTPKSPKSPKNDLSDVRGVRKLMKTPRSPKSPKNDLRDVRGVKRLMKSPRIQKSPKNDLTNVEGVKELMKSPKAAGLYKDSSLGGTDVKSLTSPKSPQSGRQTARAQVKSKSQRNVTSPEKEAPLQNSRTRNRRANLAQQSPKSEAAVAEGNTSKTLLTLIPQEEKVISAVADSTTATTRSTRNKKGSTSIESSSEPPKKRGRKEESKIYADEDLPSQSKSGARVHFDIPGTPPTPVRSSRRKKVTDIVTSPVEKGTRKLKGSTEETKPADGVSDQTIIPSPPGRRTRGTKVPVKEATPTRSKRGAKKVVEVDSPPKQQQNISVVNEDTHPAKRKRGATATVVIDSSPLTKRKRVATVAASAESPVPSKNRRVAESAVEVEVPHSPVVRKTRGRTATVVAVSSSADGSISDFDTTKQQKTKSSGSPVKRGKRGAKVVEVTPIIAENSSDVITPKQAESASRSPVKRGKRGGKVVKATSVTAESSSDVITTRQTEKDSGTPVKRGKRGTKVIELSVTPESPKRLRGAKTSEENVSADTKTKGKKSRVVSSPVSKSKSPSPLATRRTARQTKKKEVSNDNVTPDRKTRSSRRKR
ncbi:serine-rich adhesin for platelets-like isoform X2 [Periplaneta americana]|uniref:serine-rich adhesin for platelets-like isoform X2 n=1 Tax=Periplaneta americana TaxID=6978 RepID=UPI0037E7ED19